jgi:hypothetical protein
MNEVSLFRLYLMRAYYLLIVVGLIFTQWTAIINHDSSMKLMRGVGACLLGTVAVLSALGIRYPLKMIPVLLFELIWKSIWLLAFALPLYTSGQMDADTSESVFACMMGVILTPLVIPWKYVWSQYAVMPGDRWK